MHPPSGYQKKLIQVFYSLVLPLITILLLLVILSVISRPKVLGSSFGDWLIRFLLCIWFCGLYIRLSRFSEYRIYPNIKWSKTDLGSVEKYFYIGMGLFMGIGCALVTWWTVQTFLPSFAPLASIIAVVNGLIIAFPITTQYWVLRL